MSCGGGGKHVHIPTFLQNTHGVWAHLLALILWCQLLKRLTDGQTDVKKEGASFFFKVLLVRTGPNWTGRICPYFRRVFPYFRAPSGRLSGKKVLRWKEKRPFHVCIVWANLPKKNCHQNREMHPYVRNWVLRPTLTCPKMKEQSAAKNQLKEDRNHGIKHMNVHCNTLVLFLLLHFQSAKINFKKRG